MVRKRRVPWGWIGTLLVAGTIGGYFFWQQQANAQKANELPKGVQVGRVVRGDIDQKISATGVVAAETGAKVNIGSQITGRIRSLPADVGTLVSAGQVIAVLDAPDLQAQVDQQEQNVQVAGANLDQAKSRLGQVRLQSSLTTEQTAAQIEEASAALKGADERLKTAEASATMQPTQTASEIARARAGLSTARSEEQQVKQTVRLQVLQAQTSIDSAKAEVDNLTAQRRRDESLLAQGYVPQQEVDETRSRHRQAVARLRNAEANLDIVKEKNAADVQAARDRVAQAEAALDAAESGKYQDTMRQADMRSAGEAVRQAGAFLRLQQSNRTQDTIRKRAVSEAEHAVRQAQASLRQTEAVRRYQMAQLEKTIIHTPISGTVLTIAAQQGETIAAGLAAPTLITVCDLSRLEVRGYVDETDIARTRIGLPAEVRVESYPERVFHGRVVKIASASTIKDNVVTYETTIEILDANGLLRPDMTADVTLILGRQSKVLLIPSEAVHRETERNIAYVLHREKKGEERVEVRAVKVGVDDGSKTQVRSGLLEGEELVLAGLQRLGVTASDRQVPGENRRGR